MESIQKWKSEILEVEPNKPICLIMTKRDLLDEEIDKANLVTKKELLAQKK